MKICVFRYICFASKSCGFEGRHVLRDSAFSKGDKKGPPAFAGGPAPTLLFPCRERAGRGGISLFRKEISLPFTLPKKICIASEQLEELQCLPIAVPGRAADSAAEPRFKTCTHSSAAKAIRFASAPTTRCCAAVGGSAAYGCGTPRACGCRSAHLIEVRSNSCLPRPINAASAAMPLFRTRAVCRRANVTRASR